jgi:type VI secretion system protein ImpC
MRDQRAEVSLTISPDERYESRPVDARDFRILVMGDFSARGDDAPLAKDGPRRIDRDDLDAHLSRIAPRLRLGLDGATVDLAFASMEDFAPHRLAARLTALETTRSSASPPDATGPTIERGTGSAPVADVARVVSGASLLDDMLDATTPTTPTTPATPAPRRSDELSAFIERAVAPHVIRPPDRETVARASAEQHELATLLRRVLHHPRVQALESTWRAMELLVRRLDTDGELRLYILDVPRDHVAAALERLAQQRNAADPEAWALAISLHVYPQGDAGAELLARIAMAARGLDTPVVAAAPASLAGRESAAKLDDDTPPSPPPEVYALIRRSLEARFLGLTFPRLMLRAPYGRDNPAESIELEEMDDPERQEDYLWGSGAAAVALLVGQAFNERGWAIGSHIPLDVGSLPYFTFARGPETIAKSCAEVVMSERVARHLLSRGIMPLAWIKDTDRVRLVELRSVADPAAPLTAPWASASGSRG